MNPSMPHVAGVGAVDVGWLLESWYAGADLPRRAALDSSAVLPSVLAVGTGSAEIAAVPHHCHGGWRLQCGLAM